jgi:hypothetical protein
MADYRALTDADLSAKIGRYEDAIEKIDLGGDVAVIAGEGRRMEIVQANASGARQTLEDLYYERSRRFPDQFPRRGRAIGVRILP